MLPTSSTCRMLCRLIVASSLAIVTIACTNASSEKKHDDLRARISEYYRYEASNDWSAVYLMRTPIYRQSVNEKYFVQRMQADNAGWTLKEFEILSLNIDGDKALAEVRFSEIAPKEFFIKLKLPNGPQTVVTTSKTIWLRSNSVWYCADAATRMHLPLNAPSGPV